MADIDDARAWQAYLLHNAEQIARNVRSDDARSGFIPSFGGKSIPCPQMTCALSKKTINSLVSLVNSKQQKDFVNLPDGFLQHLTPYVNVYKTYTIQVGPGEYEQLDILLTQGKTANVFNQSRDNKCEGVILRSVEFQRLGGNPEEIDTNIKFTLELFAKDVCSYFKRDPIKETTEIGKRLTELSQVEISSADARKAVKGSAWIDLIKIDPGQDLDANVPTNSQMVTSPAECKIKIELGYSEIDKWETSGKYSEFSQTEWDQWKEIVAAQKETFFLSLVGHKFDFKGFQGVGLKVDFIASANADLLSPYANIIGNPANEVEIEQLREKKRFKIGEKQYYAKQRKDAKGDRLDAINTCIRKVEDSIEDLDEKINEISKRLKLGLLNQIYLWGFIGTTENRKTRVFRYYPEEGAPEVYRVIRVRTDSYIGADLGGSKKVQEVDLEVALGNEQFDFRLTTEAESAGDEGANTDFIFLGDIFEAAFELMSPSGRKVDLTNTRWVKPRWSLRRKYTEFDWSFEPRFDERGQKERFLLALKEFGAFGMGRCIYESPVDLALKRNVSIMNLPIQLDLFRNWYLETYVSSNVRSVPFRDFVSSLMRWVSQEIFRAIPYEFGLSEVPNDTPQFIVNTCQVTMAEYYRMYGDAAGRQILDPDLPRTKTYDVMYFNFRPNFSQRPDVSRLPATFVDQVDRGVGFNLLRNNKLSLGNSIPHIVFGSSAKGITKKITFQREDIPGHAEARLFSDRKSVAGNIALREKYNVDFEMIGTTAFLPGSLIYLDPLPLDIGFEADSTDNPNYAKSLGMGGMYRVVNLTSRISFDGQGNSWDTKLVTKWETFADNQTGNNTAPPQTNPDLEKCIQDKVAEYQRNRAQDDDYLDDLW